MKKISKIMAMMLALFMVLSLAAPAKADNYNGTTDNRAKGGETTIKKYLVMKKDAVVPNVEYTYTVSSPSTVDDNTEMDKPAVYIQGTDTTPVVYKGVKPNAVKVSTTTETTAAPKENTLEFTSADKTQDGLLEGVATAEEKYVVDASNNPYWITLDFSDIYFAEPGVYRYWLSESDELLTTITNDYGVTTDRLWRTIDVYVVDNAGKLKVEEYVWYEGKLEGNETPSLKADYSSLQSETWTDGSDVYEWDDTNSKWMKNDTDEVEFEDIPDNAVNSAGKTLGEAKAGLKPNGAEAGTKSDKYINKYDTQNLQFGKEVIGNQGSKDKYFKFTLTLNGLEANTVLTWEIVAGDVVTYHANGATNPDYTQAKFEEGNKRDDDLSTTGNQLIAGADGKIEWNVYLHDGQYVVVKGIPNGVTYVLAEEAEDYKKAEGIKDADGTVPVTETGDKAHMDPVNGTVGAKTSKTYQEDANGAYYKDGDDYKEVVIKSDGAYKQDGTRN